MTPSGSKTTRDERQAGYSLIEVLAALAITAALVTIVLPFAGQLVERWSTGEARIQVADQWMQAHLRMSDDVAQAVPMSISGARGREIAFRANGRVVRFVRLGLGRRGAQNLDIVTFLITSTASGDTLYRSSSPFSQEKFASGANNAGKTMLLDGPFHLRFSVVSVDGKTSDSWADKTFPAQVRLSVASVGRGWVPPTAILLPLSARTTVNGLDSNGQPQDKGATPNDADSK